MVRVMALFVAVPSCSACRGPSIIVRAVALSTSRGSLCYNSCIMELILTHGNTEFDGFASQLAAARLFPGAIPVLSQSMNRNVRDFLSLYRSELPYVHAESLPDERVTRIILVDTQKVPQLKVVTRNAKDAAVEIIDHHPLAFEPGSTVTFTGEEVGATTTLLLERLVPKGYVPSRVEATLFLLGIYEDTGSLTYANTKPVDARCVAWLLENGASLEVANEFLNRPLLPEQWGVYAELTERAEMIDVEGNKVLVTAARPSGYVEELSVLAHKLKDLYDPDAVFMLVQLDHHIEVIARSTTDAIDVGEVLQQFGGGGHGRAAAAVVRQGDLREIRQRLIDILPRLLRPAIRAVDIMTRAVLTLPPETTIVSAMEQFGRGQHSELPVVNVNGTLLGMISVEDLKRSGRRHSPTGMVSEAMRQQYQSVTPQASLHYVQQLMLDFGLTHLPVVQADKLAGIIAKADLLKVWPGISGGDRPEADLIRRIEMALPQHLMKVVWRASDIADEIGVSLYLVGGFVRDLLLGIRNYDLDIVVEGEAIEIAKRLGQEIGVKVRSHKQFGTAKLLLDVKLDQSPAVGPQRASVRGDLQPNGAPLRIDFVTARREFYQQSSALPVVEAGSIMHDLYRRDFTINTMAISLDRARRGKLIDFFGGRHDLERRLVRVLHDRSFIEDPTRILRAVRLEQRLGFQIESQTLRLMTEAIDQELLSKVSGERLRTELNLIFQESVAAAALDRLASLGVLQTICPGIEWEPGLRAGAEAVDKWFEGHDRPLAYLAFLAYVMGSTGAHCLVERLKLPPDEANVLEAAVEVKSAFLDLEKPGITASQIYCVLEPYSLVALRVAAAVERPGRVRDRLLAYLDKLRFVQPELDGVFIRNLGVRPGPVYKELLHHLVMAKLDGVVKSRKEEEEYLRWLLRTKDVPTGHEAESLS